MLQLSYDRISKTTMQKIFSVLDRAIDNVMIKDNVISIEVPKTGVFVINRQPPKEEIWLSSPITGPYHFKRKNNEWIDSKGNNLLEIISREILKKEHLLE